MSLSERSLAIEKQMIRRAKQNVLNATRWYTLAELAIQVSAFAPNADAQLSAWKRRNEILSIKYDGVELFPAYAFTNDKLQPVAGLQAVLLLFAGKKDDWGMAYWFASVNGYLDDKCPQDVLPTNPDAVLLAAMRELAGVTHG
jgi:hypothetical protein